MSTTANGYIIDVTDDDGVGIIPAPPSPQEMDIMNPNQLSSSYAGVSNTIASMGSSCPSRDSVSRAIALVRAKQVAKSAILRAEEQILQPRSSSSDQTSTSIATESSTKHKVTKANVMVQSENAVPIISLNRDKPISIPKAPAGSLISIDSRRKIKQEDSNSSPYLVSDVISSHTEVQVSISGASLPQRPSFEQNSDHHSATIHSSSDDIPAPPSFATNDSDDSDFDETVDANTIEDVNAFLSRLGVGALQSASNESNNSIDRLRMLCSSSSGASSDEMETNCSSIREVQPETLAEISAIIDDIAKKHGEREEQQEKEAEVLPEKRKTLLNESSMEAEAEACTGEYTEAQLRTSRPSPIHEIFGQRGGDRSDPPSTFALETRSQKADPPGPSHSLGAAVTTTYHSKGENPFVDHCFSGESLEDSPSPPPSAAVEDEKKIEENNNEDLHDEEFETPFVNKLFDGDVRKTLSTVEEVTSIENEDSDSADEDNHEDYNDTVNCDDASSSSKQDVDNVPQTCTLSAVASEEQESLYGIDGRKEPKGLYEKAKIEVEKIPVSNIGVEQAINNNMSLISTDSQHVETERRAGIEQNAIYNKGKASETLETNDSASSAGFSDTGSLPWALRDVASEETMRATGRRRPQFVVSGPRPSNKSRNVASLFDDTSQQASETASEFHNDLSFGSDDRNGDDGPSKNNENNENTEIETSDSPEADRCMVDTLLYNDYELETDYVSLRGISNDENDEHITMNNVGKDSTDSCDLVVAESGEVEIMARDQSEKLNDRKLKKDPSGELLALKVDLGAMSPTKISKIVATMDNQHSIGVDQKKVEQHFKELIVSIFDGHTPSLVELSQIKEAAQKANVSLEIVDQFLDYVADARPDVISLISKSWESFNEDDDDVETFFVRIEGARVAAAKKAISHAAADVEAMLKAEEDATTKSIAAALPAMKTEEEEREENSNSSSCVGEYQSNSFLRQFEDLGLKDDCEADDGVQLDHAQDTPVENVTDVMSPTMLVNYFSTIDRKFENLSTIESKFKGGNERKLVNDFKRLILPVINGNIPTIIEEAQIRQAALKANVPLNLVDAFVDYVKEEHPEVAPQVSKEDEPDFLLKGWEEIEDLDEDDAIAAFLSSKLGIQDLEQGEMYKNGDDESSESRALRKKMEKELIDAGSRDYEHSITSTIGKDSNLCGDSEVEPDFNRSEDSEVEPDFNRSEDSEVEPDFNRSEDSEVEPDFNRSEDSEVEPDFNRSKEETDCEEKTGCEKSASNGIEESKKPGNERNEGSLRIPKVVETSKRDDTDPIEMEMLKACKSIESYDEGIWQRRTAMATYGWGWEEATWLSPKTSPRAANLSGAGIHGVAASKDVSNLMFNKKSFPIARKNCKLSYGRRVKRHTGYFDVDMYSLQESAAFGEKNLHKDETPWELRHVRQRFLHERSLTFSRNWFGDLVKTSGNDKIKAPICKPKSMEMPMRNIPDPGDWTPEWYTTWGGRKLLLRRPSIESSIDSGSDSYTEKDYYDKDSLRSYSSGSSYEDEEDWEDAPECGTFVNTKQKIGEHVTRVHPDYTSSLRKSRWRRKYFPIGTFPY